MFSTLNDFTSFNTFFTTITNKYYNEGNTKKFHFMKTTIEYLRLILVNFNKLSRRDILMVINPILTKKELELCDSNIHLLFLHQSIKSLIKHIINDIKTIPITKISSYIENNIYTPWDLKYTLLYTSKYSNLIVIAKNIINPENIILEDIKDENLKDEDIKDENLKDEDIKDENLKNKDIKDENLKDEDIKDEDIKDEDIKDEDIKDENLKNKDIKDENLKDEDIKDEDIKDEDIKNENVKDGDIKNENVKDGDIKNENVKNGNKILLPINIKIDDIDYTFNFTKEFTIGLLVSSKLAKISPFVLESNPILKKKRYKNILENCTDDNNFTIKLFDIKFKFFDKIKLHDNFQNSFSDTIKYYVNPYIITDKLKVLMFGVNISDINYSFYTKDFFEGFINGAKWRDLDPKLYYKDLVQYFEINNDSIIRIDTHITLNF
jgi:hypothetical protein